MVAGLVSPKESKQEMLHYLHSIEGTERLCLSCWLINLYPYLDECLRI